MCILTKNYEKQKQYTGYKIVYDKGDKIYSPVTGIEYKPGKVTPVEYVNCHKYVNNSSRQWMSVENIFSKFYEKNMYGRTSVFKKFEDALDIRHTGERIVKMTIKGDLMEGYMGNTLNIISGKEIVKIKNL